MVTQIWRRIDRRVVALVVVLIAVGVLVNIFRSPQEYKTVTAHFPRAVSVFEGTDVRILGVNVGEVTAVIPEGNSVRVDMKYEAEYDVPADAQAVVVTPTLVADRFVQITAYEGGPKMADGADIPLPETAVPVELDRIYGSLQTLTQALGPNGVNKDGTLDNLLNAAAESLDGKGAQGNQMLQDLSDAAETFGEGAGPLFDTVTQLAQFTEALAENDELVRAFMTDLAGVSDVLAAESDELQAAVAAVARAVGSVEGFVRENRDGLAKSIRQLTTVMGTIASEKDSLDTALRIAPGAIGNLHLGFDWWSGAQNSRVGIGGNVWSADGFICGLIQQHPQMPPALKDLSCKLIAQLLSPLLAELGYLPPEYGSQIPARDTDQGMKVPQSTQVHYNSEVDPTVEGLMGGGS